MKDNIDFISEFEELLKIKEFSQNKEMRTPYYCTYEQIAKALKDDYIENINEKIERWVDVTHVMYLKNVKPVKYYFQSKMLYRDGFYEASIELSRSVCEMICYDLLSKTQHPYGDINSIETPSFRMFLNFLAMPKTIEKNIFENQIVAGVNNLDDVNFIKSSYKFDKHSSVYNFKIENGQKKANLERLFKLFREIGFNDIDNFRNDTHQFLHDVYDIGNIYIHAKENFNPPKDDATKCLNMLAHILSDIYKVTDLENKTIKAGYSDFPDISRGMNFAIEFAETPDDAQRIYYNLPTQEQIDVMMQTVGAWSGEWKNKTGENHTGILTFFTESKDHLNANLKYLSGINNGKIEPVEIRLFGNYFHIIGFDEADMKHRKDKHVFFELELFNNELLLGICAEYQRKVVFKRIR